MALQRLSALALMGALALGAAGCGDDPKSSTSTPTATPSVSPSSTGPAAPVMPELAKRNDAVGAKAFVRYWFRAVTYGMQSGDTAPMREASADECATCSAVAERTDETYEDGGRVEGGRWDPGAFVDDPSAKPPFRRFLVQVDQPAHAVVAGDGQTVNHKRKLFSMRVTVVWRDGGWLLQEGASGR